MFLRRSLIAGFVCAYLLSIALAQAQPPIEIVHAFPAPDASAPGPRLVAASDGNVYGTTAGGGGTNCGSIFRMTPAGAVTVIHNFNCADGYAPSVHVQATDGRVYGIASGGLTGAGFVFRFTLAGAYEVVHVFTGSEGRDPTALLQGSDGFFYGANSAGGMSDAGAIFRMSSTGTTTLLVTGIPGIQMLVRTADGSLFFYSEHSNPIWPVLYRRAPDGTVSSLIVFSYLHWPLPCEIQCIYPFGQRLHRMIEGPDGLLYLVMNGFYRFSEEGFSRFADGFGETLTLGSDGDFYFTTSGGELGFTDALYRMNPFGEVTLLRQFDGSEAGKTLGLVQASDGAVYGTTAISESQLDRVAFPGSVFAYTTSGDFSILHTFAASSDGAAPNGVIEAANGMLYGTTKAGGSMNHGTVFRLTGNGDSQILHEFPTLRQTFPTLMQATDGNFYGTTFGDGPGSNDRNCGSIFRITPSGTYTPLHGFTSQFSGEGCSPFAPLIQGSDGALYGTAMFGGGILTSGDSLIQLPQWGGSVFRMALDADTNLFHAFNVRADGTKPAASLVKAGDGTFFGTTSAGGNNELGTVFHLATDATTTVLHRFDGGTDGATPLAALVQASDGNFYGTTLRGGLLDLGTVFRITPTGELSVLHAFSESDGSHPTAGLMEASDGNLYGTTAGGGASGLGTIFKITLDGSFSSVHSFNGEDGAIPSSPLIEASDGHFYGTTESGGPSNSGVVYRIVNFTCQDALSLSYSNGTLRMGFRLRASLPATWSTWIGAQNQFFPLWSLSIPAVTPAVSFEVPIPGFPHVGQVSILTFVTNPASGPACGDLKTVDTNQP